MAQEKDLSIIRHSAAHLLAQAVTQLFPDTILTIGPATKTGFFYDFQPTTNFKETDLELITARMKELAEQNIPLTHEDMPKEQARELYKNNPFKLELIDGIEGNTVGIARQGTFYDLCRGGHVATTGELKHFMLTSISGSYWRAERDNAQLQRISGIIFASEKELKDFVHLQEEAAKNDHRKLGKEMDLFSFHDEGPGFPFYHPKGKLIINTLQAFIRKIWQDNNYKEIATPAMLDASLWKRSGHDDHYRKNMYFCSIDERDYAVKPMNCPGSILIFQERPRSYKELPLKLAEFGHVHRYELSGVLHGLFRARAFTIDDSHLYCMVDQIEDQVTNIIRLIDFALAKIGFTTVSYAVSTRPESSMGSDASDVYWQKATEALMNALKNSNKTFVIQEGEGAFYGPKIEVTIEDCMGRKWQCSTVQVDFFMPRSFDISYIASNGQKEHPVILHQAILGSIERFFGVLLEHSKGHLPFWLAPEQVRMLPITDAQNGYAHTIAAALKNANIRVTVDESSNPLSGKIKDAQLERIPWMLVVGAKEAEQNTITLRHASGKQEFGLTLEAIVAQAQELTKM